MRGLKDRKIASYGTNVLHKVRECKGIKRILLNTRGTITEEISEKGEGERVRRGGRGREKGQEGTVRDHVRRKRARR